MDGFWYAHTSICEHMNIQTYECACKHISASMHRHILVYLGYTSVSNDGSLWSSSLYFINKYLY